MNPFILPIVAISTITIIYITLSENNIQESISHTKIKPNKKENERRNYDDITINYIKSKNVPKPKKVIKSEENVKNYLLTEERSKNGLYYIRVYSSSINSSKITTNITIVGLIGNEEYKLIIPANIKNSIRLVITDTILDSTYEVPFDFKRLNSGKTYEINFEFNQVENIIEEEISSINTILHPFN